MLLTYVVHILAGALDPPAANALGALLVKVDGWSPNIGAFAFAVGSTLFCWLLLRGLMIPVTLAWLGVVASVLLMVGLPPQLAGLLGGPVATCMGAPPGFAINLALLGVMIVGLALSLRNQDDRTARE